MKLTVTVFVNSSPLKVAFTVTSEVFEPSVNSPNVNVPSSSTVEPVLPVSETTVYSGFTL